MLANTNLVAVSPRVLLAQPLETSTFVSSGNKRISDLAASLGLDAQAKRYQKEYEIIPQLFANARLTNEEDVVWKAFCPRAYGEREFARYEFDTIPAEVIEHWAQLKQFAWDAFEIRTTEATRNEDPLLIGIYQGARYLLARWGEEAPKLLSFDEVKRRLKEREAERIEANADLSVGEMGMSTDNVVSDSYFFVVVGTLLSSLVSLFFFSVLEAGIVLIIPVRSEERRVGKECRL